MTADLHSVDATRARATEPIECTSWCSFGDGHVGVGFKADQHCESEHVHVPASREDWWEMSEGPDAEPYSMILARRYDDKAAHVVMVTPEDQETQLTALEARKFAVALLQAAEQVEQA